MCKHLCTVRKIYLCSISQVLIRVKASGVNPVDTYIRNGTAMKPALPYTPGMDSAGVVEEVGSGVTKFKVKDKLLRRLKQKTCSMNN